MHIGTGELIVVLVVALIIFGPSKLPALGKMAGKAVGTLRHYADSNNWDELLEEEEEEKKSGKKQEEKSQKQTENEQEAEPVEEPAEEAEQHVLHPDGLLLIVQPDGDVKQCDHQEHSGDPCHQGPPPQPLPQGDGCRGRGREAVQPVVMGHAGGPQQLIGGQGTDGGHQHRQIHRRQEKQDHKKERGQHH